MGRYHAPTDRQTQAGTMQIPHVTLACRVKHVEYFFAFIVRNARTIIANVYINLIVSGDGSNADVAICWRKTYGIVQQIHHSLFYQDTVYPQ